MFLPHLQESELSASYNRHTTFWNAIWLAHFGLLGTIQSTQPAPLKWATFSPQWNAQTPFAPVVFGGAASSLLSYLYCAVQARPAILLPVRFLRHDSDTSAQRRPKLLGNMRENQQPPCLLGGIKTCWWLPQTNPLLEPFLPTPSLPPVDEGYEEVYICKFVNPQLAPRFRFWCLFCCCWNFPFSILLHKQQKQPFL